MLDATEMLARFSKYAKSPALYLYPWVLATIVWMKSSGLRTDEIRFNIPVVQLYDFSHPDQISEKDFPFAIDGERYYFTKQVPLDASGKRSKGKAGKRSKRKAGKEGAYWKSTSKDIEIPCPGSEGKPIGYMRKYTLYEDMDDKRSANWYMEEYRVLDPDGLVDQYVLCKIYDKDSSCPKYTETSIRDLTTRIIKRQLESHPDQTNSLFDNRNQSQTQFDGSNSHEDIIMQPPSEKSPPESIPPTSGPPSNSMVRPMVHDLSNEFSMSCYPSGNLNPPESTLLNPDCPCYSDELPMFDGISNEFSMSQDPSGNLNAPDGEESPLDCCSQLRHGSL